MGPHQGRVEGEENLPQPAGHIPLDAAQDAIGLLGSQGTLLAHAVWGWVRATGAVLRAALKRYQAEAAPRATGTEVAPVLSNT